MLSGSISGFTPIDNRKEQKKNFPTAPAFRHKLVDARLSPDSLAFEPIPSARHRHGGWTPTRRHPFARVSAAALIAAPFQAPMATANIGTFRRLACRPRSAHTAAMTAAPTAVTPAERIARARALHRSRIGALLRLAARSATGAANDALAGQGLVQTQLEVLAGVAERAGEDQLGIASRLGIDRSSMASLARGLEASGLLVRTQGADRRRKLLRLGPAGQGRLGRGLAAARATETALLAPLGPDGAAMGAALERLAERHADLAAAPAPLRANLAFLLRRLAFAANARFVAEGGAARLGGLDYSILTLLAEGVAEDQASLIEAISTSRSSTLPAIARLLEGGLIERAGDPGDRRRKPLAVTAAGRARIAALAGAVARYEKAFLAPLDAGAARRLHALLGRLTEPIASP